MLKFWKNFGLIPFLLMPLSLIYYVVHLINYHIFQRSKSVDAKVICVGNLVAGGSGKTPYSLYLASKFLVNRDNKVVFISRGYRGKLSSATKVHRVREDDNFQMVGDEALLLSKVAPTYICGNRYLAAKRAAMDGANIIIMDDGMQNNTLHKDETVLVFDSYNGFGNGLLLPAGPMREPYRFAKSKIDRVVIIGDGNYHLRDSNIKYIPVERLCGQIVNIASIRKLVSTSDNSCVLLTAIANSKRVINLLQLHGVDVTYHRSLSDHSHFDNATLEDMKERALGGEIVLTTSKDFVRIPEKYREYFTEIQYELKLKE